MSYGNAIVLIMDYEAENEARLKGLIAMLALPMVRTPDGRYRHRVIEIEYRPGQWEQIDGVEVSADRLMFWRGGNGAVTRFSVPASRCPVWRASRGESLFLVDDDDPRPRCAR